MKAPHCDVCGVEIPKRRRFCDKHTFVDCSHCGEPIRRRKGMAKTPKCSSCRAFGVEDPLEELHRVPQTIVAAAQSGDPRALLVALRDNIASAIDEGVPARDLAALSRRLMEIDREISVIDAKEAEEGEDGAPIPDEPFDIEDI